MSISLPLPLASQVTVLLALGLAACPLAWSQAPAPASALAQSATHPADLAAQIELDVRFANQLRLDGQPDLAVDYLTRAMSRYPAANRDPLIMVLASARIDYASALIPDAEVRRKTMSQGQAELEAFVTRNPQSPFLLQASMALAQVAIRLGEAQMAKALQLDPKAPGAVAEKTKGRELLTLGIQKTEQFLARLTLVEQGAGDAGGLSLAQVHEAKLLARLNIASAQFNLARLFNDPETESGPRIQAIDTAFKSFDQLATEDAQSAICWKALAWAAFLLKEKGEPKKARDVIKIILAARDSNPAVRVGKAWARYFQLRIIKEDPEPAERPQVNRMVLDGVRQWQNDFRGFREPQNDERLKLGLKMLQAQATYDQARALPSRDSAGTGERARQLAAARLILREMEQGDHEFSEAVRKLKILIVRDQGVFQKKLEALNSFEDCYIRAQFEALELEQDALREKDPAKLKQFRDDRIKLIVDAITKGLELDQRAPAAARATSWERSGARMFLAHFLNQSGQYERAADVTESLVRNDPKAFQAEKAGMLALQALGQAQQEREKNTNKEDPKNLQIRMRVQTLADYLIKRWPDSAAGFTARHQLGLVRLRDRKPAEAIELFETIPPAYESIQFVRYQLALAAVEVATTTKNPAFRAKAVSALESIAEWNKTDDPGTAQIYFLGKLKLVGEYYAAKRYLDVIAWTSKLSALLPQAKLDADAAKSKDLQGKLTANADTLRLLATQAQASLYLKENKIKEALGLLNPIIQQTRAGQLEALKKDPTLANGFLNLALRASVQGRDMKQATDILALMQQMDGGAGDQAVKNQLVQVYSLARQVGRDMQATADAAQKEGMLTGMTAVVEEMAKNAPKYNAENSRLLALSFGALGNHKRAVESMQLPVDKVQSEAKADPAKFKQDSQGPSLLLAYVRELRKDGRAAEARQYLTEWMGTPKNPGWAINSAEAKLEKLNILAQEEKWALAANEASALVKALLSRLSDNVAKERYYEAYWHLVNATYKFGKSKKDDAQMNRAASLLAQLEKSTPDYGSAESKTRFDELMVSEPDLRARADGIKAKQTGAAKELNKQGNKP